MAQAEFRDVSSSNFASREAALSENWRVYADPDEKACNLQPLWIFNNASALGLPLLGQPYQDGSDPNKAPNLCDISSTALIARRYVSGGFTTDERQGGRCYRDITVEYSIGDPDNRDEDRDERPTGESSDDPADWRPTVESSSVERLRALEVMRFKGIWSADSIECTQAGASVPSLANINNPCSNQTIGECGRPTNSAGEPFVALPELEDTDWIHRITVYQAVTPGAANLKSVDEYRPYVRTVNATRQTYDIVARGWRIILPAFTGRLRTVGFRIKEHTFVTGSPAVKTKTQYYEITFEIADRAEGWAIDIVNAGFERCTAPGQADGSGGTYQGGPTTCPEGGTGCTQGDEQFEGGTPTSAIKDKEGHTATSPQPLDEQGQPLRTTSNRVDPNVPVRYCRYEGRPETDWDLIPNLSGLKTAEDKAVELTNQVLQVSVSALGGTSGVDPITIETKVADIVWLRGGLTITGADASSFAQDRLEAGGDELWLKKGEILTIGNSLNVTVERRDPPTAPAANDSASMTIAVIA